MGSKKLNRYTQNRRPSSGMALFVTLIGLIAVTGMLITLVNFTLNQKAISGRGLKSVSVHEAAEMALNLGALTVGRNLPELTPLLANPQPQQCTLTGVKTKDRDCGIENGIEYRITYFDNQDDGDPGEDSDRCVFVRAKAEDANGNEATKTVLVCQSSDRFGGVTVEGPLVATSGDPYIITTGPKCSRVPALVVNGEVNCDYTDHVYAVGNVVASGDIGCHNQPNPTNPCPPGTSGTDCDDNSILDDRHPDTNEHSSNHSDVFEKRPLKPLGTSVCDLPSYEAQADLRLLDNGEIMVDGIQVDRNQWVQGANTSCNDGWENPFVWHNSSWRVCRASGGGRIDGKIIYSETPLHIQRSLGTEDNVLHTTFVTREGKGLFFNTSVNKQYFLEHAADAPGKAVLVSGGDMVVGGTGNTNPSKFTGTICAADDIQVHGPTGEGDDAPCIDPSLEGPGRYGCPGQPVFTGSIVAANQDNDGEILQSEIRGRPVIVHDCEQYPPLNPDPPPLAAVAYFEGGE